MNEWRVDSNSTWRVCQVPRLLCADLTSPCGELVRGKFVKCRVDLLTYLDTKRVKKYPPPKKKKGLHDILYVKSKDQTAEA